jgi:hypothetical protein
MTPWPELHIADWRDTYATLQLYAQIVGKVRLALTPKTNQWWNVTLYVTPRGLTTGTMPYGERTLAIDFDFIDHQVVIVDSDGQVRRLPLAPAPVCTFHDALFAELAAIDVRVRIGGKPQECPGDPWTGATEAMFYSYTVPEPPGFPGQRVGPAAAFFSDTLKEFVLPYDEVRRSPDPAAAILEFAQSTYDAGSTLAGWDRAALAYP